jgi:hypothetical protein|tara:strand:- start:5728 stop:6276 length:549 start_codon:yes stop_codon:yes gene_type:complete
MNAFDTAWTLLKADKEKCPSCDMSKSECMTQKMGCGGEMKKAYVMRKAAFRLKYDYNTLRKSYRDEYEDYSDGPPMGEFDMAQAVSDHNDGMIFDDHMPRNEKEKQILHHYMNKLNVIPGLTAEEQGMDDDDHQMASDVAQEYFVEHMREMEAMNSGVTGRDSAPSRVGVSSPQIPEQRNNQ